MENKLYQVHIVTKKDSKIVVVHTWVNTVPEGDYYFALWIGSNGGDIPYVISANISPSELREAGKAMDNHILSEHKYMIPNR